MHELAEKIDDHRAGDAPAGEARITPASRGAVEGQQEADRLVLGGSIARQHDARLVQPGLCFHQLKNQLGRLLGVDHFFFHEGAPAKWNGVQIESLPAHSIQTGCILTNAPQAGECVLKSGAVGA